MGLRELRIADFAVISSASLQVGDGFTALTGDTGAGKSVCITALRTVLGGRADPDLVRAGADVASIAAVFDEIPGTVRDRLRELGAPDDDLLTLSRQIPRAGRGGCRVNGALVSLNAAREIGEQLVEVTSQGASHRLQRRSQQREILDAAGGETATSARNAVEEAVREWSIATERLGAARRAAASSELELTRARDTVSELGALDLRNGEESELLAERLRLRHAAGLVAAAQRLAEASGADEVGAADLVARAAMDAQELVSVDGELRELAAAAGDIVERLRDLHLQANRCSEGFVVDEGRLAIVEERLDALARVKRRYGSLQAARASLEESQGILDAAGSAESIAAEAAAVDEARVRAGAAAESLSAIRKDAARRLERAVTQQLRRLALPHARFRVVLSVTPDAEGVEVAGEALRCTSQGVDQVEFRLAASTDVMPMPLDEGPSGGELSRLALAISAVVSLGDGPALVLDEVDTGIGGETAAAVGDVLAQIGRSRQVFAVTHRAEIAARAGIHLCVVKREQPGGPEATVGELRGQERLGEVARLMSGRSTRAALARAAELIEEGRAEAAGRQAAAGGGR